MSVVRTSPWGRRLRVALYWIRRILRFGFWLARVLLIACLSIGPSAPPPPPPPPPVAVQVDESSESLDQE